LVIRSFYNLVSTAENRMVVSDKSRTWYEANVAYFKTHVAFALRTSGTKRVMVVSYRRFGTTRRSHLQGSSSPRRMPGTLRYAAVQEWCTPLFRNVGNYHFTLREVPEEQRPHSHRGASLKARRIKPNLVTAAKIHRVIVFVVLVRLHSAAAWHACWVLAVTSV
jgi:hypothetical protein